MSAIAVVIGIDDYKVKPLTSAVNDAIAFRAALIELELVNETDVTLLTWPPRPEGGPADGRTINKTMKEIYDLGADLDRLYFFFAGHGLTAWTDAARSVTATALIPPEIEDITAQSRELFNFDNLRARFESAGPAEQFHFVDACRDLVFADRPANIPDLGWAASRRPRASQAAQATIYAVSPGGQAQGVVDGAGIFTSHLLEGLRGGGIALVYSDELDEEVVTVESLRDHAKARVLAAAKPLGQWTHQVMLPDLRPTGPPTTPILVVRDPPRPTLTLSFDPLDAAPATRVELTLRGEPLQEPLWPPNVHGQAVPLRPRVYRIRAESDRGVASADPAKVDLREVGSATIRIGAPPPPLVAVETAPGPARVRSAGRDRGLAPPRTGHVRAEGVEPGAVVELVAVEPPYRRWEAAQALDVHDVPPGSYVIRFRVGADVYSEAEIDVTPGENLSVRPGSTQSPLLAEALEEHPGSPVVVSESIGPMFSSALLTVLPIVGVLPFDTTGELFQRFRPLVPDLTLDEFSGRPVRIVVAIDGDGWPVSPHEMASGVRCKIIDRAGRADAVGLVPLAPGERGWGRVTHGSATAPGRAFTVRVESDHFGTIELAAASLIERVTVVGIAPNLDGTLGATQHLLRVPGRDYPEPRPSIPYGRFLRQLVLGQRLYESGELASGVTPAADMPLINELLYAKWTDPVLGCMAYYALRDAVASGLPSSPWMKEEAARNLLRFFGDLPDARVIAALESLPNAVPLENVLDVGEIPVLARSLREAAYGPENPAPGLDRWAGQVAPETPWTLLWQAEMGVAAAGTKTPVTA